MSLRPENAHMELVAECAFAMLQAYGCDGIQIRSYRSDIMMRDEHVVVFPAPRPPIVVHCPATQRLRHPEDDAAYILDQVLEYLTNDVPTAV